MKFHKEGRKIIFGTLAAVLIIYAAMIFLVQQWLPIHYIFLSILFVGWIAVSLFFRIPRRIFTEDSQQLISPADGTIVTIEEVYEKEYIKEECLQISIFMSGTDVHVNRYPANGTIEYVNYHKGNYFIASYPKSSIMNERSSIGMRLANGQKILLRQVAGVMARRIVCYAREGEEVKQNQEMGFIKFGSRVDIMLPLGTEINVALEDVVRNGVSPIAKIG